MEGAVTVEGEVEMIPPAWVTYVCTQVAGTVMRMEERAALEVLGKVTRTVVSMMEVVVVG